MEVSFGDKIPNLESQMNQKSSVYCCLYFAVRLMPEPICTFYLTDVTALCTT